MSLGTELAPTDQMTYDSHMRTVVLKAHYDGEKICLDEPFHLSPDAKIFVTVIAGPADSESPEEWYALAQQSLARAYGEDEPDYSDLVNQKPDEE